MLPSHSTIDRQKSEIEKRITELQKKLKAPPPISTFQPSFQSRVQPCNNHETYLDLNQRRSNQNPIYERKTLDNRYWKENIDRSYDKSRNNSNMKRLEFSESKKTENPYLQKKEEERFEEKNYRDELFGMMKQIMEGQKNLQRQITQLKSEWHREQSFQQEKKNLSFLAKSRRQKPVPPQNITDSQINDLSNIEMRKEKIQVQKKLPIKNKTTYQKINPTRKNTIKKLEKGQNLTIMNTNNNSHTNRYTAYSVSKTKQSNDKKTKNEVFNDIANLVRHQKTRGERLILNDENKKSFWSLVNQRIRDSQKQFKDSNYRNNRHEHEHLIYTNQLQKKLKEDLISKVYSKCNSCIYK